MYKWKVEKLAVGYPWSSPFIWDAFAFNALQLERPSNSKWMRGRGWCPARRHIDLCEQALEWGASHILILGADQVHPTDMIPQLIKRIEEDGCDVISALVPTRGTIPKQNMKPFQAMAWRYLGNGTDDYESVNREEGELQKVDFIGSGVLLFPASALSSMSKPWFKEHYMAHNMARIACMDTNFVWRLKMEAGLTIWVDTTIKVGHLSPMMIDDTFSERFSDYSKFVSGEVKIIDLDNVEAQREYLEQEAACGYEARVVGGTTTVDI